VGPGLLELQAVPLGLPAGLELEWLGVAGYRLTYEGVTILVDPYVSRVPLKTLLLRRPARRDRRRARPHRYARRVSSNYEIPITTAIELPGAAVKENLGIAFGLVVRSMGFTKNFTAGWKSLRQGEVSEYTELLEDARRHAIDRMVANAQLLGANAIVSMRFDSSEMGNQLTEVVAYGTAVVVERAG